MLDVINVVKKPFYAENSQLLFVQLFQTFKTSEISSIWLKASVKYPLLNHKKKTWLKLLMKISLDVIYAHAIF